MEAVIIALITAGIPAITTLITSHQSKKRVRMNTTRTNILQLITIDKINVLEGGKAENYQAILEAYDDYTKNGGNSYCKQKVEEYKKWYNGVTAER
jgi:hypothetical protein